MSLWRERDGQFELVDVNDAGCAYAGLDRDQLLGRSPGEIGGNAARARRDMLRASSTGKAVVREIPYVHADGDVRMLEIVYRRLEPGCILAFATDVTAVRETEEQLRVSEGRYRALVAAANEGVWLVDRGGRTTFANGRVGRMLGYPGGKIIEGNLLDHVDESDRSVVAAALACPLDTPDAFEVCFRRSDGQALLCLLSVSPMPGGGREAGTLCVLADMTVLQRERELRLASERRFRRMVETANEGIWTGDPEGNTTFVNETAARMLGIDPTDALGLPFTDFVADHDAAERARAELVRSGHSLRAELRLLRADGTPFEVIASLSLLRDESGRVTGSLAMVTDVTRMKREQADLRESRERFAQVFEEAPVGMVFLWAGHLKPGRFLGANRAFHELLGVSEAELPSHDVLSLTHPDDVETERALAHELFEHRRDEYELDKRFVRPDGRVVWARFRAAVLRDARGAPLYGLGVAVDISAQKQATAAAARAGARARALLDATSEALVEVDENGTITELSTGAQRMFGLVASDGVGGSFADRIALPGLPLADWQGAHAGAELEPVEATLVRADGTEFPAMVRPLPVGGGVVLHISNLAVQGRESAARQDAETRFRQLFVDAAAGIVVIDGAGRVADVNPAFCRLADRPAADLLGREATAVLVEAEDRSPAPWIGAGDKPGPLRGTRRVERPDGQVVPVQVIASVLRDGAGRATQWICQCSAAGLAGGEPLALHPGEALSYRERQVLSLLAHGLDGPAIAERLGLSTETIRSYAHSAREKTGAKTRTEAVALALVRGEISI